MNEKLDRVGEVIMVKDTEVMILLYENNKRIYVEFQDETKYSTWTTYENLKKGIKNPHTPRIFGIGYIGNAIAVEKDKIKGSYEVWHGMLERCYDDKFQNKCPTYVGCYVTKEWHCYENFEKWYINNYYKVENEVMNLDKDIRIKGNKLYSPETCIFVPQRINKLFIKSDKSRNGLIGTTKKYNGKYKAQYPIATSGKRTTKVFSTELEAFNFYKKEKEKCIKQIADEYYNKIPTTLYEAMYKYEVNIND